MCTWGQESWEGPVDFQNNQLSSLSWNFVVCFNLYENENNLKYSDGEGVEVNNLISE